MRTPGNTAYSRFPAAFMLFLAACVASVSAADRKPNILFILTDDLGYGDVGCYGQKQIKTPNIDKLASEGVRFTQCYAGSTVCAPSRSALMTGLHTGHTYHRGNRAAPMLDEEVTVAEVLKKAGYATAVIGKWGMGPQGSSGIPQKQGFDEFIGFLGHKHAHDHYTDHVFRMDEKLPLPPGTYAGDLFTSEAVSYIRRHKSEPFFLYLAYTIPHSKLQVPSLGIYADKDWPESEKKFAAMISRMDAGVGEVIDALDKNGLTKDTMVFFSSDNGPHHEGGHSEKFFRSSGPLRGMKRDLYDGGIRVPMIVRKPGQIPAGKTSDHLWAFWDFLPTAAEIAGAQLPDRLDGQSQLAAILSGETTKVSNTQRPLYWEFHEYGFEQAIRRGDWKAVKHNRQPTELYNLKTDIAETRNVASQHPEVLKTIEPLFTSMRTESAEWPIRYKDSQTTGPEKTNKKKKKNR